MSCSNSLFSNAAGGRGLPAEAYTSTAFYREEMDKVFARSWVCIGSLGDVANIGDVRAMQFAGQNLLITRAKDENVRVFFNYCRHRGLRLQKEPCKNTTRLSCPYHAWMYGLDGKLIRAPHIAGPDDHDAANGEIEVPEGLEEVRTAFWNQLIFVNVSGDAPPFETHIAPLADRWSMYDFSRIEQGESSTYDVGCNWKLAIENFIDVYHIPFVHPGLEKYNSFRDHYMVHDGPLTGEGNNNVEPSDSAVGKLDEFPGLPEEKKKTLEALSLFPNLLATVTPDYLRFIVIEPLGPEKCREHVRIFVNGKEAATGEAMAEYREQLRLRFEEFNNEDLEIAEELQASMNGSAFRRAYLSPAFDKAVQTFHTSVASALNAD